VNYLFVAVWFAYLWRWWTPPAATSAQNPAMLWGLRAFFFIVIFNATVVFAVSPMRVAGILLSLALLLVWVFQSTINNQQSTVS
jgi:hypothetical protein